MKFSLVVLILCFCLNLISAFSWFNFRSNEQPKQVTSYRQGSTRQQNLLHNTTSVQDRTTIAANKNNANHSNPQSVLNQKQNDARNSIAVYRQANGNNTKSSIQTIPQNRSQGLANQQQYRAFDSPVIIRQTNHTIQNTTNPRVRPFLPTRKNNITVAPSAGRRILNQVPLLKSTAASKSNSSSVLRSNDQPIRSALTKAFLNSTKAGLLRSLTTTTRATENKGVPNRQSPLAEYYYRQRLRAFDPYKIENNTGQTNSSAQTAVRRQKREDDQNKGRSVTFNSMVYVRDASFNDKNLS
jgi:hypothetical protein